MAEIGVIGSGSWGTALALVLNKNGHHVTIWSYLKEEADEIRKKRENPSKLPGVHIPEEIEITTDLQGSVEGKDVVVLAVPSMATRATAKKMCPYVKEEQILVNVAKGIEEGTLKTLSEQIEEEIPQADVAVLSGPSHAEEVGKCICSFWSKSRRRSKPRTSDNGCSRSRDRRNRHLSAENFHE